MIEQKAINWIESTRRSLQASVPEVAESAPYLTERLSILLLERLPLALAAEVLTLLPEDFDRRLKLRARRGAMPDATIGFTEFVELTRYMLGLTDLLDSPKYAESEEEYANLCQHVAESFLWAVAQELPIDLKDRIAVHLPGDLRSRMNLYTGYSAEDKVA